MRSQLADRNDDLGNARHRFVWVNRDRSGISGRVSSSESHARPAQTSPEGHHVPDRGRTSYLVRSELVMESLKVAVHM